MKVVSGTFNGTGADVYLCIGFVPDFVNLWNAEGTQRIKLEWNAGMSRSAEIVDGVIITGADQTAAALTTGAGIKRYYGGKVLASGDVGTTTYGEGVYLKWDFRDYRYPSAALSPHGVYDAVTNTIDTWTKSSTALKGNFNADVTGTYIGEGSSICIDGRWYSIVALTAGQGITADEVTLDQTSNSSGVVQFVGGKYSMIPMIAAETTKNGFLISNVNLNVDDAICVFEAGNYTL